MRTFAASIAMVITAQAAFGAASVWNFNGNLNASSGPGSLTPRAGQASLVSFGTASSYGLPLLSGQNSGVMYVGALTSGFAGSGFDVAHGTPANGGGTYGNQYSLGFDMLLPSIGWHSFYNTNEANANDGDAFINPSGGMGISGNYTGAIAANTWARVFITVDLVGTPTMNKYINGVLVGTQTLNSGLDGRWALYTTSNLPGEFETFILFGDNDGDQKNAYLSSFYFNDRTLSATEVAAYGAADGAGIPGPATLGFGIVALAAAARRRRA